jgi:hypothetical protein
MAANYGLSGAMGWGVDMCVAPICECYATRQTEMSGKTYHVGVTNVEDLTLYSLTF